MFQHLLTFLIKTDIAQLKTEITDDGLKDLLKSLNESNEDLKEKVRLYTNENSKFDDDIKRQIEKIDRDELQLMKKYKPLKKIVRNI